MSYAKSTHAISIKGKPYLRLNKHKSTYERIGYNCDQSFRSKSNYRTKNPRGLGKQLFKKEENKMEKIGPSGVAGIFNQPLPPEEP